MNFKLKRAAWDRKTERAYVEVRTPDNDGGEAIATAIFTFRTTARLTNRQRQDDIVRKARYIFRRAGVAV
jgi:hypothetical protein